MAIGILGRLVKGIYAAKEPVVYSTRSEQGVHIWIIWEFGRNVFQQIFEENTTESR